MDEKIPHIVTSALPYANGPIHIGHLAGAYLPADIYVRFLKLMGEDVIYICGTDEHGTPITFQAESKGLSPQQIVDQYSYQIHSSLLSAGIEFDYFGRTSRSYHQEEVQSFFLQLLKNGFLEMRTEEQFYCSSTNQFLPDRYIEGECPYCGYTKARGDECSKCGKWLEAEKLHRPRSPYCPMDLTKKKTQHWYLLLDKLQGNLEQWIDSKKEWKDNVRAFVQSWFKEGLHPRAITRDLSWGIPVPLEDKKMKGKVLYVWFDAPIGYLSMTKEWAKTIKKDEDIWKKYWLSPHSRLIHFIGKDNIPFHAIVWPAILMGQKQGYVLPSDIPANEHLTINGEKISSSRGNAIWIEEIVSLFGKDYLRLYLAITAPENRDADFSWEHFANILNTELVNNLGNLAQRVTTFLVDHFGGIVPPGQDDEFQKKILLRIEEVREKFCDSLKIFRVKEACKILFDLCREGNAYFQSTEPWKMIKENASHAGAVCHILVRLLETVGDLLLPIIPDSAHRLLNRLGKIKEGQKKIWDFNKISDPTGQKVTKGLPLFPRIEEKVVLAQNEILKYKMETIMNEEKNKETNLVEEKPLVNIQDFSKISLQTGRILEVENVPKSEKLLRFRLKTADGERQILSGLAQYYPDPKVLLGTVVVFIANLPVRKMMGLESNGMILSAENADGVVEVVQVSENVGEGAIVK